MFVDFLEIWRYILEKQHGVSEMNAEADMIIDELRSNARKLESDLDLAKGEAYLLRIKLSDLGVCNGDCSGCEDEPCTGAI